VSSALKGGSQRAAQSTSPGVIRADELYRLDELQARLQAGEWAIRQARRKGLRMYKIGKRKYVKGADVLAFLDANVTPESGDGHTRDEDD